MTTNVKEKIYTQDFVWPLNEKQAIIKWVQFDVEINVIRKLFADWLMEVAKERWWYSLTTASPPVLLFDEIVYGNRNIDEEIEKYKQSAREMLDAPHVPFEDIVGSRYEGCPSTFAFHKNDTRASKANKEIWGNYIEQIFFEKQKTIKNEEILRTIPDMRKKEIDPHTEDILKILGQYLYIDIVNYFVEKDENFDVEIIYFGMNVYKIIEAFIFKTKFKDIKVINLWIIENFIETLYEDCEFVEFINEFRELFEWKIEALKLQKEASIQDEKEFNRSIVDLDIWKPISRTKLLKKLSQALFALFTPSQVEGQLDYFEKLYKDELEYLELRAKLLNERIATRKKDFELSSEAEKKSDFNRKIDKLIIEWETKETKDIEEKYLHTWEEYITKYAKDIYDVWEKIKKLRTNY